jgi:peptidoglycan/xylan/chitin deacetylase (PgdA/CDA1 family)
VGDQCKSNSEILRETSEHGHVIANHGFHHKHHAFRGREFQRQNVLRADDVLRKLQIRSSRLFRPPYGSINPLSAKVLADIGYRGVMWSLMVWDWREQSQGRLWPRLRRKLHDGSIIVLHDAHNTTHHVIQLLPRLADEVRSRGWKFAPLDASVIPQKPSS